MTTHNIILCCTLTPAYKLQVHAGQQHFKARDKTLLTQKPSCFLFLLIILPRRYFADVTNNFEDIAEQKTEMPFLS